MHFVFLSAVDNKNNCLVSGYMGTKHNHKIQNGMEISTDLEKVPYELDMLNNLPKHQMKMEEEIDQKKSSQLKKDDNEVITSDDELTSDNEIFNDVISQIQVFAEKSKQERYERNLFILEWKIFNEFFNLIEKHQTNFRDEDLFVVKRGLKLFIHATSNVKSNDLFLTDLVYAKEIFYLYFNLLNINLIQNSFKNDQMSDHLKILYRPSISRILDVMIDTSAITDLALNDSARPINCIELLSLMLNYVQTDLKSSNISLHPSSTDASITRKLILLFLWCYSDKIILVTDLIEVGALEIMINILRIICE
jgi:hypothetical protein